MSVLSCSHRFDFLLLWGKLLKCGWWHFPVCFPRVEDQRKSSSCLPALAASFDVSLEELFFLSVFHKARFFPSLFDLGCVCVVFIWWSSEDLHFVARIVALHSLLLLREGEPAVCSISSIGVHLNSPVIMHSAWFWTLSRLCWWDLVVVIYELNPYSCVWSCCLFADGLDDLFIVPPRRPLPKCCSGQFSHDVQQLSSGLWFRVLDVLVSFYSLYVVTPKHICWSWIAVGVSLSVHLSACSLVEREKNMDNYFFN